MIGKSKLKRLYYYVEGEKVKTSGEYIVFSSMPILMYYKTDMGMCSGPAQYTARHCFGRPFDSVSKKPYQIHTGVTGTVIQDFSPPLLNILYMILRFLGFWHGVKDVVKVDTYIYDTPVAVLTGGILNQNYVFITAVPGVKPHELVGQNVEMRPDFPEETTIRGRVIDYAIINFFMDNFIWPHEVYVVESNKPARPGNSGTPVYII